MRMGQGAFVPLPTFSPKIKIITRKQCTIFGIKGWRFAESDEKEGTEHTSWFKYGKANAAFLHTSLHYHSGCCVGISIYLFAFSQPQQLGTCHGRTPKVYLARQLRTIIQGTEILEFHVEYGQRADIRCDLAICHRALSRAHAEQGDQGAELDQHALFTPNDDRSSGGWVQLEDDLSFYLWSPQLRIKTAPYIQ